MSRLAQKDTSSSGRLILYSPRSWARSDFWRKGLVCFLSKLAWIVIGKIKLFASNDHSSTNVQQLIHKDRNFIHLSQRSLRPFEITFPAVVSDFHSPHRIPKRKSDNGNSREQQIFPISRCRFTYPTTVCAFQYPLGTRVSITASPCPGSKVTLLRSNHSQGREAYYPQKIRAARCTGLHQPLVPDATWLRVEIKTGMRRFHLSTMLSYTIVAGILVLDEKLKPLTDIVRVAFNILTKGDWELMHDKYNWRSFVRLLKTLILTKYGWKGEMKERGLPYFLTTGDGVVSW